MKFHLLPFPSNELPDITVSGEVERKQHRLSVAYSVEGDTGKILLPAPSVEPARKPELWTSTCFEAFFAVEDQPGYWEVNMSPSGDWNVYRMDAYRRGGFREEVAIRRLPFSFQQHTARLDLHAGLDLSLLLPTGAILEIGIAAVIQTKDGRESYWALSHPGAQADFHVRESFTLALAGQSPP